MGKLVLTNCYIVINGTNLSDHVSEVVLTQTKKSIDTTSFSGGGTEATAGLIGDTLEVTFQSDYAAASVNAVIGALQASSAEFPVEIRPTSAARSTTNPGYTATCILFEFTPLSGKVGDLASSKVKIPTQRSGFTTNYS